MPKSRPEAISYICDWLMKKNPREIKSVLDIGCGFGKWGFLIRLYLQLWVVDILKEDYQNYKKGLRIDAIELYEPYITNLQREIYNNIVIGDVRELIKSADFYDLIIMGDVLEHISFKDGMAVLREALKKSKYLIIAMPGYFEKGAPFMGNDAEIHQYVWQDSDFPYNPKIVNIGNQRVIIYDNFELFLTLH